MESETDIDITDNTVHLSQTSNYPWDGNVAIQVQPEKSGTFDILVRIPGWAQNKPVPSDLYTYVRPTNEVPDIKINGEDIEYQVVIPNGER